MLRWNCIRGDGVLPVSVVDSIMYKKASTTQSLATVCYLSCSGVLLLGQTIAVSRPTSKPEELKQLASAIIKCFKAIVYALSPLAQLL